MSRCVFNTINYLILFDLLQIFENLSSISFAFIDECLFIYFFLISSQLFSVIIFIYVYIFLIDDFKSIPIEELNESVSNSIFYIIALQKYSRVYIVCNFLIPISKDTQQTSKLIRHIGIQTLSSLIADTSANLPSGTIKKEFHDISC